MKLSVAIMAHPRREHFVRELQDALPEAVVVWDERNDRWDTGRRSLLAFDPEADYHVVIQDDAIPCRNLLAAARQIAPVAGERIVSFYTGKVRPHQYTITPAVHQARANKRPYIETWGPYWGPGLMLPTQHIPGLVEWGDRHPEIKNYDRRIEVYYRTKLARTCLYTVPSLVDHRRVAENPSLVPGRPGDRHAHWFIGEGDPLEVDWAGPPHPVGTFVTFTGPKGQELHVRKHSARYRRLSKNKRWKEAA